MHVDWLQQCIEGHAVCSTCREKLMASGNRRCHVCRVDIGHGAHGGVRPCTVPARRPWLRRQASLLRPEHPPPDVPVPLPCWAAAAVLPLGAVDDVSARYR